MRKCKKTLLFICLDLQKLAVLYLFCRLDASGMIYIRQVRLSHSGRILAVQPRHFLKWKDVHVQVHASFFKLFCASRILFAFSKRVFSSGQPVEFSQYSHRKLRPPKSFSKTIINQWTFHEKGCVSLRKSFKQIQFVSKKKIFKKRLFFKEKMEIKRRNEIFKRKLKQQYFLLLF